MGFTARHCSCYRTRSSFNNWGSIYGASIQRLHCGMMVYSAQHAGAPGPRHISDVGGFWESYSTLLCGWLPCCYRWHLMQMACINQPFFLPRFYLMSRDYTRLCPVPRTNNNVPHWSSHTDASFEGWTSWKNVKHPGNPRGAFPARQKSNKCLDLRGLTCH